MADQREPTQAMPNEEQRREQPPPTQPTDERVKHTPKSDDEGFGGFMGHGGQSDITDETIDGDEGNPNAAAESD
jgi:hypothetical protein